MTQYFSNRQFSLVTAPLHTRVLITSFSVVILVALAVGLISFWDKTSATPAGITSWYLGNEGTTLAAGEGMAFEKSFRELLDATHPHLFGQGVLLFILSHIVALTTLRQSMKILIYLVSFGAMLLDASVPWLIRYVSPDLAALQIGSIGLLTGAFVAQLWFPLREMWFMGGVEMVSADSVQREQRSRPSRSTPRGGDSKRGRSRPPRRDGSGPREKREKTASGSSPEKRTGGANGGGDGEQRRRRRGVRRNRGGRPRPDSAGTEASSARAASPAGSRPSERVKD